LYSATPLQQVLTKQIAMAGAKIAMLQSPLESARNPTTAPACPMACATASVISRVESSPAKQSAPKSNHLLFPNASLQVFSYIENH